MTEINMLRVLVLGMGLAVGITAYTTVKAGYQHLQVVMSSAAFKIPR